MFDKLDIAPGWKTKITAVVGALFNTLNVFGVVEVDPSTVTEINGGLIALIGLFLAMKIDRGANV